MTKRRDPGQTPPPDTLPDRAAVERALETVLDRLRPKPPAAKAPARRRRGAQQVARPGPPDRADT
jgi:hypothetical protein